MISRLNENDLKKEFDLIVIGGGINGCGIARDASERGLKVLLLEKEDFGSGCTAASTRLIHGGLRYLEHCEFDLVRESLLERELLLKNAKHLVSPLELCIPIYKGSKRGCWLIKAGMILYDILSFDKSLPNHRMMSRDDFLKYEPSVKSENLIGAAIYYDTQVTYPERICIENILMAKQGGALLINHAEVTALNISDNKICSVEFVDHLSGVKSNVKGKIVVNASGPWVDELCSLCKKNIKKKIGGTRGSHIIVRKFVNGPSHAIYTSAKSDSRPFFIIPWQDYYLIGTTDIPVEGNINCLKAGKDEIKYLLNEANNILENINLTNNNILFSYCGVRPLPYISSSLADPSKVTRKNIICDHREDGLENFFSVIGGKLTTYRNLSEQLVNLAYKKLNCDFVSTKTKTNPLIGNINSDLDTFKKSNLKKAQKKYDLDPEIIFHLMNVYGARYKNILDLTLQNKDLGRLLSSHALDIRAQVDYSIHNELAFTISDVLLRRTSLGLNEGLGQDAISEVAKKLQEYLNLSSGEIQKQVNDYSEKVLKLRLDISAL